MSYALPADYHTHTHLCKHAEGVPLDYAVAAAAAGLPQIAATDHCPTDDQYGIDHRMALEQFEAYCEMVEDARTRAPVPILFGIEADYYRGCQRFLAPWLERHAFDLVLGSVHFLNYWGHATEPRGLSDPRDSGEIWALYFQRIGELADTRMYDIVAHLDLPKRFLAMPEEPLLREWALPALDRIAAAGMAIEINTAGLRHSPRTCYPNAALLRWARERGIGLTFGSDAHHPSRVGEGFVQAIRLAREAGYATCRQYANRSYKEVPLPELSPLLATDTHT